MPDPVGPLRELRRRCDELKAFLDPQHAFEAFAHAQDIMDARAQCANALEYAEQCAKESPEACDDAIADAFKAVDLVYTRLFPKVDEFLLTPPKNTIPVQSVQHEDLLGKGLQKPLSDDAWMSTTPSWRISRLDTEHPRSWDAPTFTKAFVEHLQAFEQAAWGELLKRKSSHPWESTVTWAPASQKRVLELELDDQTTWIQLQTGNRGRVYGFREGHVLHVVWWDTHHEVYPTEKKNT